MSFFIKTEHNIFEVVEETNLIYRVKAKGNPHNIYSKSKCQNNVIARADTIEELCDGFIGVHDKEWFRKNCIATKGINYFQKPFELEYGIYEKDFANVKLKNQNGWEYTAIEWQRDEHDFIFGYIETDKGLIYVAKMNEKGTLELI